MQVLFGFLVNVSSSSPCLSRLPQGYRLGCLILIRTNSTWASTVPPGLDICEETPSVHLKNKTLRGLDARKFRSELKPNLKIKGLSIRPRALLGCSDISFCPRLEQSVGNFPFIMKALLEELFLRVAFLGLSLGSHNTPHQLKGSFPFISHL